MRMKGNTPSTQSPGPAALADPHAALASLRDQLKVVASERVALSTATGRVLAEPVVADRPSPSCDVSAMDGYAVRLADLANDTLAVVGEVAVGHAPPTLPAGKAVRIFTGGAVPDQAEAVVPREQVTEAHDAIMLSDGLAAKIRHGANIRWQGENLASGEQIIAAGRPITPAVVGALASFGVSEPRVYRRVRVSVLVTGNELLEASASPTPWQLRDSNGPTLYALLKGLPWIEWAGTARIEDDPDAVRSALTHALTQSDVVMLTGGVSMGDHDYVPAQVRAAGGEIVFHKLALRPGKPMLGAVGPSGQAILGLPGNPVSVLATGRRFGLPVLRHCAGHAEADAPAPVVRLREVDGKSLHLWWYRPVRLVGAGEAELVPTMGSGDVVGAARSDGVIELPPHETGAGPWPFFGWSVAT